MRAYEVDGFEVKKLYKRYYQDCENSKTDSFELKQLKYYFACAFYSSFCQCLNPKYMNETDSKKTLEERYLSLSERITSKAEDQLLDPEYTKKNKSISEIDFTDHTKYDFVW